MSMLFSVGGNTLVFLHISRDSHTCGATIMLGKKILALTCNMVIITPLHVEFNPPHVNPAHLLQQTEFISRIHLGKSAWKVFAKGEEKAGRRLDEPCPSHSGKPVRFFLGFL